MKKKLKVKLAKPPRHTSVNATSMRHYLDACAEVRRDLAREPMAEEVAAQMGCSLHFVHKCEMYVLEDDPAAVETSLRFRVGVKNESLEHARKAKGLKVDELSAIVGMGPQTYAAIENCRVYPPIERQRAIASALGRPVEHLFPPWLSKFTQKWREGDHEQVIRLRPDVLAYQEQLSLESPEEVGARAVDGAILATYLNEVLCDLDLREQKILSMRYGLDGNGDHTLEEVGNEFGVNRERIRQIEAKAIEKIKEHPMFGVLREFHDEY